MEGGIGGIGSNEGSKITEQVPTEQENVTQERSEQTTKPQDDSSTQVVGFEKEDSEEATKLGEQQKEASEQAEKTQAIVETPAVVIEKGDYQTSEALQEAFTEAVIPPDESQSDLTTESTSRAEVMEAVQKANEEPGSVAEKANAPSVEAAQTAVDPAEVSLDGKGGDDTRNGDGQHQDREVMGPELDWMV